MTMKSYDRFEYVYKTFSGFSISKITDELNKLGQEGWELMSILNDPMNRPCYIFKRKISEYNV